MLENCRPKVPAESRVEVPTPRVNRRLVVPPREPVNRNVPPARTKLEAALVEAPRPLAWPPLATRATVSTPPLMTVAPVWTLSPDSVRVPVAVDARTTCIAPARRWETVTLRAVSKVRLPDPTVNVGMKLGLKRLSPPEGKSPLKVRELIDQLEFRTTSVAVVPAEKNTTSAVPSFVGAAPPTQLAPLFQSFVAAPVQVWAEAAPAATASTAAAASPICHVMKCPCR